MNYDDDLDDETREYIDCMDGLVWAGSIMLAVLLIAVQFGT